MSVSQDMYVVYFSQKQKKNRTGQRQQTKLICCYCSFMIEITVQFANKIKIIFENSILFKRGKQPEKSRIYFPFFQVNFFLECFFRVVFTHEMLEFLLASISSSLSLPLPEYSGLPLNRYYCYYTSQKCYN